MQKKLEDKKCSLCRLNKNFCYCEHIPHIDTDTKVSLLVHVRELSLTTNTANLAHRCLNNSELLVRGSVNGAINLDNLIDEDRTPLYLFPDKDAKVLDEKFLAENPGPYQLIVPDGSWSQAKKFKRRESVLSGIQSVTLPPGLPSEYLLRKEPNDFSLCTFEAIARTLGILDSTMVQEEMEQVFRLMVYQALDSRRGYIDLAAKYDGAMDDLVKKLKIRV